MPLQPLTESLSILFDDAADTMDRSEEVHSGRYPSVKLANSSKKYTDDSMQHSRSNIFTLTRNGNHATVQSLEEEEAVVEDRYESPHEGGSVQRLNYHVPQIMGLELPVPASLPHDGFAPMQLGCFSPRNSGTDDPAVHLDTYNLSANILGRLNPTETIAFYNCSPGFCSSVSTVSAPATFTSLETYWNSLGYSDPVTHSFPESLDFWRWSTLSANETLVIKPKNHGSSGQKSSTETSHQRLLRKNGNLERNRVPYWSQKMLRPSLRRSGGDPGTQLHYSHGYQGRVLQPDIKFSELNQSDGSLFQYPNSMSHSNMENNFNNSVRNTKQSVMYPGGELNSKSKDESSILPIGFPDNGAYQYSAESQIGNLNAIDVLNCITMRAGPRINLGIIDMSCAFVICRITAGDFPIVYASNAFRRLTGYSHEEVFGRDCRFLQEPTGNIEPGLKHRASYDKAVRHLKYKINARSEVQECLVNYRKGGQPFLNLLTVVPIRWLSDEYNFSVGFQIDIVDSPQGITGRNLDGSYIVNYRRIELAPNIYDPGGTTGRDQNGYFPSKYRKSSNTTDVDETRNQSSFHFRSYWGKVFLGSPDFLFHVISTSGVFLYVTPSASAILEYEPKELAGSMLSSICHPSDIVTVVRELRDCEPGSAVNLLYRIRRKTSGYTWFESLGSVYLESTRKQKHVALLGKLVAVFTMSHCEVMENGGINEGEIWAKISTSGILLFVSSSAGAFLDRRAEGLVGESVQNLLSGESLAEFENALGVARSGKQVSCNHGLQHRRGHLLQVQSTIYPGEKTDKGSKPAFLILQIRLLKLRRPTIGYRAKASVMKTRRKTSSGITMHQLISPDICPPRCPDVAGHGYGNQYMRPSPCSSLTGPQPMIHPVVKPDPSNMPTRYNKWSPFLSNPEITQERTRERRESCNIFEELNPTRTTNWQTELEHLKRRNNVLVEELQYLTSLKKRRKRKRDVEMPEKDCSQCHTKTTPEWRRGPSGNRDLCNSCGLRWAKQVSTVSA
ncbi:hypothetical protein GX48_03800 [Paracoccidioides brasiliensis]|nr:hypothetical protein GX48_03800 [Paracoccidioides brasiliensis]